jgi:hypothetical protein
MTMTLTNHERAEFQRMATAAYKSGRNPVGHRFSVAGALATLELSRFDALMNEYREWLVFGWPKA